MSERRASGKKKHGQTLLMLINHAPTENPVEVKLGKSLQNKPMQVWKGREGVHTDGTSVSLVMDAAEVVTLLFEA